MSDNDQTEDFEEEEEDSVFLPDRRCGSLDPCIQNVKKYFSLSR
jgi:hypothetical protein